jgi:hypothetical protein
MLFVWLPIRIRGVIDLLREVMAGGQGARHKRRQIRQLLDVSAPETFAQGGELGYLVHLDSMFV